MERIPLLLKFFRVFFHSVYCIESTLEKKENQIVGKKGVRCRSGQRAAITANPGV